MAKIERQMHSQWQGKGRVCTLLGIIDPYLEWSTATSWVVMPSFSYGVGLRSFAFTKTVAPAVPDPTLSLAEYPTHTHIPRIVR